MVATTVHRLDAYAYLESAVIIQLSCCTRQGLQKEWDYDKISLLKSSLHINTAWKDRIVSLAMPDALKGGALDRAIAKLPAQFHESVFLSCARIVGLKGFEQDLSILADIKEKMGLDDYRAEVLLDLAKAESQIYKLGAIL